MGDIGTKGIDTMKSQIMMLADETAFFLLAGFTSRKIEEGISENPKSFPSCVWVFWKYYLPLVIYRVQKLTRFPPSSVDLLGFSFSWLSVWFRLLSLIYIHIL